MKLSDEILSLIQETFVPQNQVLLHEPKFEEEDLKYVEDCVRTGWVSTAGKYVEGFEKKLTELTGIPHAIAVVNGTCALHASILSVGVQPGDEVLVPSLTFVATANAVSHCGAIPHFVASEENTLGVDSQALAAYLAEIAALKDGKCFNKQTGRRIAALVPVHIYGTPCDLEPLLAVCEKFSLPLIEDAAESLGSWYRGKHTGAFGKLATLSFNGNKVVTTGGGGAILTSDPELAKKVRHLTTTAKIPHAYKFFHDQVGFNYRLPNLNAALGLSQLERFGRLLENKIRVHEAYRNAAKEKKTFTLHEPPVGSNSNFWLNVAVATSAKAAEVSQVFEHTQSQCMQTRPAWELLHHLPMYAQCPRMDLDTTESLASRLICLPSSPHLAAHLRN